MTDGDKCLLSHKFQLVGGVAGGAQVFGVSEKWVQILTLSLNLLLQQVTQASIYSLKKKKISHISALLPEGLWDVTWRHSAGTLWGVPKTCSFP